VYESFNFAQIAIELALSGPRDVARRPCAADWEIEGTRGRKKAENAFFFSFPLFLPLKGTVIFVLQKKGSCAWAVAPLPAHM